MYHDLAECTTRPRLAAMRLLVLGGTSFVGRALVERALSQGHELTLFSRGRTGAGLFPQVPRRTGDRDAGDYASLADGSWDAVVDVSGYVPRHVREAAGAVGDVGRYLFVSTGSVYDLSQARAPLTEDAPRWAPEHGTEDVTPQTYGPLKVACEDEVAERFGERATVVRPGVVAGPHDPTDRFTWWARRAARGGRLALAGRPEQPVQVVDSRDLAALLVALLEADAGGTWNAVGPAEPVTLAEMVRTCAAAAGSAVELVPVDPASVDPPLPLVLTDPADDVLFRRSAAPARAAGLTATPLEQTARDVLAWDRERGEPPLSVGTTPQQEAELLHAAHPSGPA
ncbi:MAG: isoflavone reductase [uncultured Frankineae bacterium]|uniref:Isoflavone reductase n=1 Tax=uncultured Frankineae bacterium TaxID=437475 RepID=A0A6J4MCZ2_9ACTN|nr:MAG: isoflavone reductase [uncultured Frankineae bacterium]